MHNFTIEICPIIFLIALSLLLVFVILAKAKLFNVTVIRLDPNQAKGDLEIINKLFGIKGTRTVKTFFTIKKIDNRPGTAPVETVITNADDQIKELQDLEQLIKDGEQNGKKFRVEIGKKSNTVLGFGVDYKNPFDNSQ